MTSEEYVIWLKGFATAAGEFTLTPKQWDDLKDELNKVDDTPYVSDNFTIGPNGAYERDPNQFPFGVPNLNSNGTAVPNPAITTTPGTGYITVANPIASFGGVSSITYTTGSSLGVGITYTVPSAWSGGTTYTYPNGTTVSYTAGGANEFNDLKDKTLLHD